MAGHSVIVTGGAGFIGSHTCKMLAANGVLPIAYDNLSTGHRDAVRWGPLVEADILDTGKLAKAIGRHRADAVIHFAASAYVGESMLAPQKYYRNNVVGSVSVLDACLRTNTTRLVFSSSCATYGVPQGLPIREDTEQRPISPYGRSKLMVEQIIADHAQAYGLRYAILRYFNASGADPDGELGERHDPETHLIPLALLAAFGHRPGLTVYGDDYDTPDGTCIRDYIHVTDLARGHLLALRHLRDGGENLALNLGSGRAISIRDVLDAVARITGYQVPIKLEARRPGDPPALLADTRLARERLGFSASLSDLDTIIRTAAPFFRAAPARA